MLRIRAATSPGNYEQREFAREAYYAKREETPGRWVGRGAELLNLRRAPAPGELAALLEGNDPRTGAPLSVRSVPLRNAGFDLTFTAPKSVSVLLTSGSRPGGKRQRRTGGVAW
jgi:conjugative relaxase-like TrwC/TraI family protein